MIDHVILGVRDLAASRGFYERALAPLGIGVLFEHPTSGVGFGTDGMPSFFIASRDPAGPVHLAFASPDHTSVDAFHEAALTAGGRDNGPPGLRAHIEAVFHQPDLTEARIAAIVRRAVA